MFTKARIRITAWYIVIISLVSLSFSVAIYKVLTNEIDRIASVQKVRWERWSYFTDGQSAQIFRPLPPPPIDADVVLETKRRIISALGIVNFSVILLSGGFAYILSGRTLSPIKEMMDDQNRFVSDASHELRTPLTSLKSAFEVFLRQKTHKLKESENLIVESLREVDRIQTLSESMLRLTSYGDTENTMSREKFDLLKQAELVTERLRPLAIKKKIALTCSGKTIEIMADKDSVAEVMTILIDNAIKYTKSKGNVKVKVGETNNQPYFEVVDDGIGIREDDKDKIFERFYQVDKARSRNGVGGYGLGLSIAKKLLKANNAKIELTSTYGKGTKFSVRFQ